MIIADEIGPLINTNALLLRIIAGAILAGLGFVVYLGRDGRAVNLGPIAVRLPDSRTWSRQFLVTAFDIAASATVLYVLLPQTAISWPVFLAVYAIAVGLGVLSHVPAGLGVFETVIIASLGSAVNIDAVLGSLVLYRLIYHVLPLLIAVLAVSLTELRRFVDHPAASSIRRIGGRLTPQLLWIKKIRTNVLLLFLISLVVNVGMWLERFVIVVTSLHRDFLPSSWGRYSPTVWDWGLYVGTIGLFLALLFLFLRFLPMISIFEMRTLVPDAKPEEGTR